jgi:hypothetical protein
LCLRCATCVCVCELVYVFVYACVYPCGCVYPCVCVLRVLCAVCVISIGTPFAVVCFRLKEFRAVFPFVPGKKAGLIFLYFRHTVKSRLFSTLKSIVFFSQYDRSHPLVFHGETVVHSHCVRDFSHEREIKENKWKRVENGKQKRCK